MEVFVAKQLYNTAAQSLFYNYLFVHAHRNCYQYDGPKVGVVFKNMYLQLDEQVQLNMNQYRHVAVAFADHYIADIDAKSTLTGDNGMAILLHQQAGHSRQTATKCYGVSNLDLRLLS